MEGDQKMDIKEIDNGIRKRIKWTWHEEKDQDGYFLSDNVHKLILNGGQAKRDEGSP